MTGEQLQLIDTDADKLFAEAREWRRLNPKAFGAIVAWAYEDANRSGRCAMQRYIEALRDPAYAAALFVHRTDEVYLVNHNLRSALTRLIMAEHPGLPFRHRKSKCDVGQATYATPEVRPR